jgi:hypothetical protein
LFGAIDSGSDEYLSFRADNVLSRFTSGVAQLVIFVTQFPLACNWRIAADKQIIIFYYYRIYVGSIGEIA